MNKELPTQNQKLIALYKVSAQLGTTLDLAELLNLVMDSIISLTGAERGLLMLRDSFGNLQLMTARSTGHEDLSTDAEAMQISRTIINRAVENKRPILTDNAQADERFSQNQSVVGYQLRSIMCAPLLARGAVIGAVYVDNRLMSGVFNREDLDLLVMFANQAAIAIDNARLFQRTDQALERRIEELTLFQQIDHELNKSLDLKHVLNLSLDWAIRLTYADGGSIGLIETDEETDEATLRLFAHRIRHDVTDEQIETVNIAHPILAEVLATQQEVQTPVTTAEQAIDGSPAFAQLVVPIKNEGNVLGIITLESHMVTMFIKEDVEFVRRLADRAAVAINNSRLYEAIQTAHDARSQFISLVTHELRLPLTSIRGYTDLLLKGMGGEVNEQQTSMLEVIHRNTDRMSVLISDLSDINRMESGRMNFDFTTFDMRAVIQDVTADLREAISQKSQTLHLNLPETPLLIHADRNRMAQVLGNLISNAHKYTPNEGQISITAVSADDDTARLEVQDSGIGISTEDQQSLFSQFFRAEDPAVREQTGWGLGLAIVQMLVEEQKGQINFESTLGEGSRFFITVPLAPNPKDTADD